jgi:hypothetical protein
MDGFLEIFIRVGSEPASWLVIGILGLWAGYSVMRLFICPYCNLRIGITAEQARSSLNKRVRHPLSYLFLMLLAMGIAVAGLFGLSAGEEGRGTLSFFLLATGLFLILTLPVRMRIKDAELRVIAAPSPDAQRLHALGLRQEHHTLIQYELGVFLMLVAVLVAF